MTNDTRTAAELQADNDRLRLMLGITRNNLMRALDQVAELEASLIIERRKDQRAGQRTEPRGPNSGSTINV